MTRLMCFCQAVRARFILSHPCVTFRRILNPLETLFQDWIFNLHAFLLFACFLLWEVPTFLPRFFLSDPFATFRQFLNPLETLFQDCTFNVHVFLLFACFAVRICNMFSTFRSLTSICHFQTVPKSH